MSSLDPAIPDIDTTVIWAAVVSVFAFNILLYFVG